MKFYIIAILLAMMPLFNVSAQATADPITVESLLQELIDREQLAHYPSPYYETRQFSSYDRRAEERGGSSWFANLDRSYFIRTEKHKGRTEYVMMDDEGPGALTRFWMTFAGPGAGEGTLRIYLDGERTPVIEDNVLDILSGGALVGDPLAASVSPKTDYMQRGHNLYLPIPYREHIKITYESDHVGKPGAPSGSEAVYYNINYRTYEANTEVITFQKDQLKETETLLQKVQRQLGEPDKKAYLKELKLQTEDLVATLKTGESRQLNLQGPGAIRHIALQLEAPHLPQALRSTVLEVSFDGRRTVWVPVGDFFGTGYQIRPHDTWYTTITADQQLHAYWLMPFEDSARVALHNLGTQTVRVKEGRIDHSGWTWTERDMHFGASWKNYADVHTGERKSPDGSGGPFDFDYTHLKGQGVYVGDVLTLFNTSYAWWGEGDEKIYIDGEKFPSHFGTGTEDYYGYAWARPQNFTHHPYISQPDGSGNLEPGYVLNLRYRGLDAIPFDRELEVDMEMWHWVNTTIDYAPTSFFYTRPGSKILVSPDTGGAKTPVSLSRTDIISPEISQGRVEGENLALDTLTAGNIKYQNITGVGWSQNKQLWWYNGEPEDQLQVYFTSDRAGEFQVKGKFTTAHDYGKVRIRLNGKTAVEDFNGYSDSLGTKTVNLGTHAIAKGKNSLNIEIMGYSPEEQKAFWGLDFLSFEKP